MAGAMSAKHMIAATQTAVLSIITMKPELWLTDVVPRQTGWERRERRSAGMRPVGFAANIAKPPELLGAQTDSGTGQEQ